MASVIKGILGESRDYYRKIKRENAALLLINTKGSLYQKVEGESVYLYLERTEKGTKKHIYLGKDGLPLSDSVKRSISQRKKAIQFLREAKSAMKELGMPKKEITNEDYLPIIRELFQTMADHGLWDEGMALIGSWCFKVYQNNCGVEFYPARTLDVDFAIRLPYRGEKINLGDVLKSMGFEEVINHADGTIFYQSGEISIEFMKDRTGNGQERGAVYEPDLGIAPVAVPYMRILLDNPMEIKARDLGRVVVPSMPAFFIHKLLLASVRREKDKRLKDYRQVEAVAKSLLADQDKIHEVRRIALHIHKKWLKKVISSVDLGGNALTATRAVLLRSELVAHD